MSKLRNNIKFVYFLHLLLVSFKNLATTMLYDKDIMSLDQVQATHLSHEI